MPTVKLSRPMLNPQRWWAIAPWSSLLALSLLLAAPVMAQSREEATLEPDLITQTEFLQDPLEDEDRDPLVPAISRDRPLSPLERRELAQNLDQLRQAGQVAFDRADKITAYEIWKRELRLRRLTGLQAEATALGEVGAIAWADNETAVVRMITLRLQAIRTAELDPNQPERDAATPVNYDLLRTVGMAFRAVRDYDNAVASYEQIAGEARRRGDLTQQEAALNAVAELHMGWFKYAEAATVYQELLAFAQNRGDREAETLYLENLATAYDQGRIRPQAIATQEQLTETLQANPTPATASSVTALKLAIAGHYRALGDYRQAALTYQEAYAIAQTQQQYGYASDALKALADLYTSLDRVEDALYVYNLLVEVERQSYNTYGEMEAYDRIAQLYQSRNNAPQAISAYRLGLALAQSLNYRVDYFTNQINSLLGQ